MSVSVGFTAALSAVLNPTTPPHSPVGSGGCLLITSQFLYLSILHEVMSSETRRKNSNYILLLQEINLFKLELSENYLFSHVFCDRDDVSTNLHCQLFLK